MKLSLLLTSLALLATGALAKPALSFPKREIFNPLLKRQASAGDQPCATGCTSASDEALLQQITACAIPDWSCFCSAWNQLDQDPTCAACLAVIDQTGQLAQMCGPNGITASATNTATAASSSGTGVAGSCMAQCSSASDQAAVASLGTTTCAQDAACVCTTLFTLSSDCQECIFASEFLTVDEAEGQCAPYLSSGAGAASSTAGAGGSAGSPTQGSGSSAGGSAPTGAVGGSGASGSSSSSAAPAASSPAAPHSGALPSIDLKMAMAVLGGMVAGGILL